ncbi:DUF4153 domain-containing protein [Maribacter sp. 2307ULW6-5]|uniref:DUF4153 domain-containing protein n=1 Tax=Maribacter sp. 2307ULW6-5 TaxID=3386275 RepID=UPI0039BD52F6
MTFPSLSELAGKASSTFQRFPVSLAWAVLGTIYAILSVEGTLGEDKDAQAKMILTLVLGVSWLIGLQFFVEQQKHPRKWLWLKPMMLLLLVLFYWHIPDISVFDELPEYITRFFLFLIAGHLFVFFAPFVGKWNHRAYWNYLNALVTSVLRSGFFSGVLYLGLILALSAVDALFGVRVDGDLYFQVFLFCLGIVNTWIYLSDFPKDMHQHNEIHFRKALEVLVKYILIPLIMLYMLILYAYAAKIALQWELPQGWVSYLVTALALLGFLVQVMIDPVQKQSDSWTISKFHPWFYRLMLPLVGLLFVAIFRRISDYGITENRYFVVAIACWILGIVLYLLFHKGRKLVVLPTSLFVLCLLASFGFWGAASVSQRSQLGQFKKVYQTVLDNEKKATQAQYGQLESILNYLEEREALADLNEVTGLNLNRFYTNGTPSGSKGESGWYSPEKVLDSLGLVVENGAQNDLSSNNFYYYNGSNLPISYAIEDYQKMVPFRFWTNYKKNDRFIGDYQITYNHKDMSVDLFHKTDAKKATLRIPIKNRLTALSKMDNDLSEVAPKEFLLRAENDSLRALLIFAELDFYKEKNTVHLSRANTLLLLGEK